MFEQKWSWPRYSQISLFTLDLIESWVHMDEIPNR